MPRPGREGGGGTTWQPVPGRCPGSACPEGRLPPASRAGGGSGGGDAAGTWRPGRGGTACTGLGDAQRKEEGPAQPGRSSLRSSVGTSSMEMLQRKPARGKGEARRDRPPSPPSPPLPPPLRPALRGQRGGRGAAGSGAWGVGVGLTRAARTRSCLAVSLLCPSRLGGVPGAGFAFGMPCAWLCHGLHGGQLSGPLSGDVSVFSAFLGLCGLFFKKIIHRPLSWGCKRGHPIRTAPQHHLSVVFLQPYVVLHSDGKSVPLMQVPL